MPLSEAKKRANQKWNKKNLRVVRAYLSVEEHAKFLDYCDKHGYTQSTFIKDSIREKMEREMERECE